MNIKDWKTKVLAYNEQLNEQLKNNENAKDQYYGFEVIDGKIIENPEILFVGINPGKGNGEPHYEVKFESERCSYIDPFDEGYTYPLAEFSICILRKLGLEDDDKIIEYLETKCVKTNLYHIITKGTKDIKPVLDTINSDRAYRDKCNEFCIDLIKAIKPKIIIFEGKGVYNSIVEGCCEAYSTWNNTGNLAYFKIEDLNTHCIGYKRNNIGGFEIKPELVAEKIKELNLI